MGRSYCKEKLANYKVPAVLVFREAIPKTQTGKFAKKILKQQEEAME